jgi:hypothetical protein
MKRLALLLLLCACCLPVRSQQMVTEPSTEKQFPGEVSFKNGDASYTLNCTGVAVRKKAIFRVYGMVHYMQDPVRSTKQEAFTAILTDGKAKQITMEFVRDVDAPKIRETYLDSFKANAPGDQFAKIEPLVTKYVGYFTKDVKENDQFVIRWLPGGTIIAIIQGEEKPAITDQLFAKTLWSIWFGEDSIVNRDKLVQNIATDY